MPFKAWKIYALWIATIINWSHCQRTSLQKKSLLWQLHLNRNNLKSLPENNFSGQKQLKKMQTQWEQTNGVTRKYFPGVSSTIVYMDHRVRTLTKLPATIFRLQESNKFVAIVSQWKQHDRVARGNIWYADKIDSVEHQWKQFEVVTGEYFQLNYLEFKGNTDWHSWRKAFLTALFNNIGREFQSNLFGKFRIQWK